MAGSVAALPMERKSSTRISCSLSSLRHVEPTPRRRRLGLRRIPAHQQHLQFVCLQRFGLRRTGRPEAEPPARQTLLATPEPLAVIHERFDRGTSAITEDEQPSAEWICLELLLA